jgi:hypothetical protein
MYKYGFSVGRVDMFGSGGGSMTTHFKLCGVPDQQPPARNHSLRFPSGAYKQNTNELI